MKKKKYYAITTTMTFEKTVLVPVDSVEDIDEAIDLVEDLEFTTTDLMEAERETNKSPYADENGICKLIDSDVANYQIIDGRQ